MSFEPDQQLADVARVVTPSVDDITIAVQQLLLKEPSLPLKKLHAGVKALHSDWLVSEARVKKIRDGLADFAPSSAAAAAPLVHLPAFDEHGRVAGTSACGLNFNFRSVSSFVPELDPAVMTQLHSDCRRAFLMKSYWLAATAAPRCMLETIARSVFDLHTRGVTFDAASSGAEWWVHFRGPGEAKKLGETCRRATASRMLMLFYRGEHRFPLGQRRDACRLTWHQSIPSSQYCHLPQQRRRSHCDPAAYSQQRTGQPRCTVRLCEPSGGG